MCPYYHLTPKKHHEAGGSVLSFRRLFDPSVDGSSTQRLSVLHFRAPVSKPKREKEKDKAPGWLTFHVDLAEK